MKSLLLTFGLSFAVAGTALAADPAAAPAQPAAAAKPLGAALPSFSAIDLEGNIVSTADYLGEDSYLPPEERKVMMLCVFQIPCKACEEEVPLIKKMREVYAKRNVEFIYFNAGNPPETVRAFVKKNKMNFKVLLDEEVSTYELLQKTFKFPTWFPVTLVFTPEGKIVGKPIVGAVGEEVLRSHLDAALAAAKN